MKNLAITGILFAMLTGVAFAGEAEKMPAGDAATTTKDATVDFSSLDTNSDGYISGEEAAANKGVTSSFSELDSNKDDRLSAEEFSEYKVKSKW